MQVFSTKIISSLLEPHIGHLTSAVYADVINRWHSQVKKRPTFFLTGTDEHGIKIQNAALASKLTPKQKVDKESLKFRKIFDRTSVSYDRFIRTTDHDHVETVTKIWKQLVDRDYIYKSKHIGWYSVVDECFYTNNQIQVAFDPVTNIKTTTAKETGNKLELVEEENYFFSCSKLTEKVRKWLKESESIYPVSQRKLAFNMIENTLHDVSISRPRLRQTWGIPVPGDSSQTIYVWFDALLNYVTGIQHMSSSNAYEMTHIIGKDILRFHAIFWPALVVACDLPLPKNIIVHSHWTINNSKISKSKGNVFVEGLDTDAATYLLNKYGSDALRYFLIRDGCIETDSDFSESLFKMRYQVELADKLGNLLSRCFGKSLNPKAEVPQFQDELLDTYDKDIINCIKDVSGKVEKSLECERRLDKAFDHVVDLISLTNKYLAVTEPWKLIKQKDNLDINGKAFNSLYIALESLRVTGILLQPVIPIASKKILDKLNIDESFRIFDYATFRTEESGRLLDPSNVILFKKLSKD